jgi:HEAT repeat protein
MGVRLVLLLMFISFAHGDARGACQDRPNGNQAIEYVALLKSFDEAIRNEGKSKLLKLGAESIRPLVALLEDLLREPFKPWFAVGREREGKEAWDHYQAVDPREVNVVRAASDRLAGLEISGRLRNDTIELLGRLRAHEAVPLLIRIMEQRDLDNASEKMRAEMYALAAIGSSAVPALIESIRRAQTAGKGVPNGVPPYLIQVRSARVLGLIGDARALPVLKEMLSRKKDVIVWKAIEDIKRVNRIK